MRTATVVLRWIVGVAGVVQILLGLSIWIGFGLRLTSLHILNGFLIVAGLWILAILALVVRGRPALAAFALLWGVALPAFGMTQYSLLVGSSHWIIRVIHLLMGIIALGTADALVKHILSSDQGKQVRAR